MGVTIQNLTENVDPKISDICVPLPTIKLVLVLIPLVAIVLAVILGNLLVIAGFFKKRSLRTPPNVYLVSLAFVDLSVGLLILPLNIQNHIQGCWKLGKTICKIYSTADVTLCAMSILHLCAIATDRYRAIKDGVSYIQGRSLKTVISTILAIALASLWISSPPILGWDKTWLNNIEQDKNCYLVDHVGYRFYSGFGALFLPFVLMALLYKKIYSAIHERLKKKFPSKAEERSDDTGLSENEDNNVRVSVIDPFRRKDTTLAKLRRNSKLSEYLKEFMAKKQKFSLTRERRAARTLGIIMGCFCICWVPFGILYVLAPALTRFYKVEPPPDWVFEFFTWMGYLNSALNPIIYGVCNSEFRDAFKSVLGIAK